MFEIINSALVDSHKAVDSNTRKLLHKHLIMSNIVCKHKKTYHN